MEENHLEAPEPEDEADNTSTTENNSGGISDLPTSAEEITSTVIKTGFFLFNFGL